MQTPRLSFLVAYLLAVIVYEGCLYNYDPRKSGWNCLDFHLGAAVRKKMFNVVSEKNSHYRVNSTFIAEDGDHSSELPSHPIGSRLVFF